MGAKSFIGTPENAKNFCPQRQTYLHYEKIMVLMSIVSMILEHGDVHTKLLISPLLLTLDH